MIRRLFFLFSSTLSLRAVIFFKNRQAPPPSAILQERYSSGDSPLRRLSFFSSTPMHADWDETSESFLGPPIEFVDLRTPLFSTSSENTAVFDFPPLFISTTDGARPRPSSLRPFFLPPFPDHTSKSAVHSPSSPRHPRGGGNTLGAKPVPRPSFFPPWRPERINGEIPHQPGPLLTREPYKQLF